MNKIYLLVMMLIITLLSGCTEDLIDEDYILEPLLTVLSPVEGESQDVDTKGVITEPVNVSDIEWETIYETDEYAILSREVPDDMIFIMIAYPIETDDCSCNIGAKTRYQYVILENDAYYDIFEYHQKYHNLNCDFLSQIDITYSTCTDNKN